MGLPFSVPQGYETLCAAARRTGFAGETLKGILVRAGVKFRRNYGRSNKLAPRVRYWMVDPEEVDRAVRDHLHLENLTDASYRLAVSQPQLRKLMVDAGRLEPGNRRGQRVLLDPTIYDEVVSKWRETPVGRRSLAISVARRANPTPPAQGSARGVSR